MAKPLKTTYEENKIITKNQVQSQIIRGLRYLIVLHILKVKPIHGYGIISLIRKNFGTYLGPSSVYPLLKDLEDWGYVESTWKTHGFHPRKVFELTTQGQNLLEYMERSVGHILMGIGITATQQPTLDE
jgi:DNA-binding PadR family transcriptional regulator